jgi:hypothetical protein
MSGDEDRLAAAKQHTRGYLLNGDTYELVFHRRRGTGEKMTPEEILHDWCLLRPRLDPTFTFTRTGDFSFAHRQRMSAAKLEKAYAAAIRDNDPKAHRDLINEAIARLGRLPNTRANDLVRRYTVAALEKYLMLIFKKRGRKAEMNFVRNEMIVSAVENLQQEFDIKPTRGWERKPTGERDEERAHGSGCSIVASVLAEGGLSPPLTEQAVEKLWQRRAVWP